MSNIRKKIFFMLDKDKEIANQLKELKKANSNDEYAKELQERCIADLMKYVKKYVPFYKNCTAEKLEEFPIVNKVMMKNDMFQFRSTAEYTLGKIRFTSGSTGIPFEIYQDKKKAKRVQAELIYYREITGDELGTKFINLISPSRLEKSSKLNEYKQNVINFDVTKMDDTVMEELHQLLVKNHKIKYMMGYASALEKIANYFKEKEYFKEEYSIKAIVSSSEVLTNKVMNSLSEIFRCAVYDRYSNEDNGFIAQTDGINHDFLVNRGSFFVEILKMDSNELAEENELGRIVITDYYNYAQPFVRYDTGDLGAYTYKEIDNCKRYVLTKIAGRISDVVFDMNDKPVSTFAIGCTLEVFSNIKQYQLIQEDKGIFRLNIIDPKKYYKDEAYIEALETVIGKGVKVLINYLDELPTLNSGKFHRVICKYKPKK